jgi:hypothetical protein
VIAENLFMSTLYAFKSKLSWTEWIAMCVDEIALGNQISANRLLTDHYRCSEEFAEFSVPADLAAEFGYFRFGSDGICFGQRPSGASVGLRLKLEG